MQPALLKSVFPSESLQEYIREYQVFRFLFDSSISPPIKFHAPRPEHSITFYVRDAQKFSYCNSPNIYTYSSCVINGMYTVPINRYGGNDFWAIKVILQPSTLFHLINLPLTELTNKYINAEEIWGEEIRLVCEQLKNLNSLNEMIAVIEIFLLHLFFRKNITIHPIDKVAGYLLNFQGRASLDLLASQSCLSIRQFIRKFELHMGISAKAFQRIIRFNRAYRMKNKLPHLDWLSIALRCEYYDYQHLVKDFKEFTNLTPPAFGELESKSPERSFGLIEF